jgi:hypothetical protein
MKIMLIVLIAISSISMVIYGWFFQIKWWKLVFGIPAFLAALGLETLITTPEDFLFVVLLFAPIIEESVKLLSTIYGKDVKTGVAVGLMFAMIENAMYFNSFGFIFITLFLVREFTDPILHATTTSISVKTWKKSYLALPIAIGMHMGWNLFGYLTVTDPYLIYIPAIIYVTILYFNVFKKERKINVVPEGT